MKKGTIVKVRKSRTVHPVTVEIDDSLYTGLLRYCQLHGRSKRWIIEDALNCWIVQRDMERQARQEKTV